MIVEENQCVDCGLPCMKSACPYYRVFVAYCDRCGEYADYRIDDSDLCEKCAKKFLAEVFDEYIIEEKAELLKLDCEQIK